MSTISQHLGPNVQVLKEDFGLIGLYKPIKIKSHPNGAGMVEEMSLLDLPYNLDEEFYYADKEKYYLLNRIDSPTSGVVLLADNLKIAEVVRDLFAQKKVKKTYLALVKGRLLKPKGVWKDKIGRSEKQPNGSLKVPFTGSLEAITHYLVLDYYPKQNITLLELSPKTGRTHQLRVQCAKHFHPILGDKTYGDFNLNKKINAKRLNLHAQSLELELDIGTFFAAASDPQFDNL